MSRTSAESFFVARAGYGHQTRRIRSGQLSSRRKLDSFYKLEPKANLSKEFSKLPESFYGNLLGIIQSGLDAVEDDSKTLEEALQEIQSKAQEALIKANTEAASKAKSEASTETTAATE